MRSAKQGGLCAHCGRESDEGLFWANNPKVLDFGVPGVAPIEPDMTMPTLCDDCQTRHNVYTAYAENQSRASMVYGARTPQDALHLMGVPTKPTMRKV